MEDHEHHHQVPGRSGCCRRLVALGGALLLTAALPALQAVPAAAAAASGNASAAAVAGASAAARTLLDWGNNAFGELGDGMSGLSSPYSDVPVKVKLPAGTTVLAAAAGCDHGLALTSAGRVLAWGDNNEDQLGDGSTTSRDTPVQVKLPAGTKITAISAGCYHSLALTSAGRVLAWGYNASGQLGNGSTTSRDTPVTIATSPGGPPVGKVTALSAGCNHSLALTSRGVVLAWGFGGDGQLGDGSMADRHTAVRVKLPAGTKATAISAGCLQGLALTSAARVLAWGENSVGQLGDGTTTNRDHPVAVKLAARLKAIAIAAGSTAEQGFAFIG